MRIKSLQYLNDKRIAFVVPEGVKSIGRYAFAKCSNLKRVILSSTVETIEIGAFYDCRNLESIYMPPSLRTIERDVFKNCDRLRTIIIPDGVKTVSIQFTNNLDRKPTAVNDHKLIWLPNSLKEITDSNFVADRELRFCFDRSENNVALNYFNMHHLENMIGTIHSENDLYLLGESTYYLQYCGILPTDYLSKDDLLDGKAYRVSLPNVFVVEKGALANNHDINDLSLGKHCISVKEEAFLNCTKLKAVIIPYGTKEIRARAFKGCTALKYIAIPDTVIYIGPDILENTSAKVYCIDGGRISEYCRQNGIETEDASVACINNGQQSVKKKDYDYGSTCYYNAFTYGSVDSLYDFAMCLINDPDRQKNVPKIFNSLTVAARAGNKPAMYQLYRLFKGGNYGFDNSPDEAKYWLERSGYEENAPSVSDEGEQTSAQTIEEKSAKTQMNFADKMRLLDELYSEYNGLEKVYFYGKSDKANKKIQSAVDHYATNIYKTSETAMIVFDDTLFGGAEDGFLLTDRRIYVHNTFYDPWYIEFKDISTITVTNRGNRLLINAVNEVELTNYNESKANRLVNLINKLKFEMTG